MSREEKLQQFAEQNTKGLHLGRHNLIQMVKQGAEWADQHPHWIPVDERLPEERGNYIVYARRKLVTDIICEAIFDSKFWYKQSSGARLEVTHWMPLPVPPRKEE